MSGSDNLNGDQFFFAHQMYRSQRMSHPTPDWGAHPLSKWGTAHPMDVAAGVSEKVGEMAKKSAGPSAEQLMQQSKAIISSGHAAGGAAMAATKTPMSQREEEEEDED